MSLDQRSAGLLLCLFTVCSGRERPCVLGLVGESVSLPCFYPDLPPPANLSVEWRRGGGGEGEGEEEVVLRSEWAPDGQWDRWSTDGAAVSADAALTGNMTLVLPSVEPTHTPTHYRLFVVGGANHSAAVCSVCLTTVATFSRPELQRSESEAGEETSFWCQSSGGFPEPRLYWLINLTEEPPEGASVWTDARALPDSLLFNVTSLLTLNVSTDDSVSCVVENPSMNQSLTATSYGAASGPLHKRASEAMWMFSTGLSVVVGIMVLVGVGYQIHLDRLSKRRKKEFHRQLSREKQFELEEETETEAMNPTPKETDV